MSGPFARAASAAAEVAGRHADSVDRDARFPAEAFAALKDGRLLGAMVPRDFGGEGASLTDMAAVAHALAQQCPSSGLIFAMHQIQVACLVRHGQGSAWHRDLMARLAAEQLLLASATTEAGIGGDVRSSACSVEGDGDGDGDGFRLEKQATVISYGAEADAILVTARRKPDSPASDQVIVPVLKDQLRLEEIGNWDTLGMRGTRSIGYHLRAEGVRAQIMPLPYADISAQTMLPVTHILWSSAWLGIASDAVARAGAFVRAEARKRPGTQPPGARRLAEVTARLQTMRGMVRGAIAQFEEASDSPDRLTSMGFAVAMNTLKMSAAEMVVRIVEQSMLVAGLSAYRNDSPYSLGRHLRDAHSAPLMISNDRVLGNTANLLLAHKDNGSLFG
ncbi:acyl-CoA dehydrogenase family protein [Azospirillum rugosum]|uniref:Acyl-CoA dehydrogenase n=1 Tax=Azospirillum rugosum TaxID=416170 RepID=A0ABS4SG68_9PROT|nr:acyl-CoA dehydrogenase family protein [Azospirillum rugosum]MBP2291546.1 acyl-CoA dehydrogenase [Azospirillum rugosum]MDQ0525335.1 acyl-CoA dehydrogenase [Azospirillum rugosum]